MVNLFKSCSKALQSISRPSRRWPTCQQQPRRQKKDVDDDNTVLLPLRLLLFSLVRLFVVMKNYSTKCITILFGCVASGVAFPRRPREGAWLRVEDEEREAEFAVCVRALLSDNDVATVTIVCWCSSGYCVINKRSLMMVMIRHHAFENNEPLLSAYDYYYYYDYNWSLDLVNKQPQISPPAQPHGGSGVIKFVSVSSQLYSSNNLQAVLRLVRKQPMNHIIIIIAYSLYFICTTSR